MPRKSPDLVDSATSGAGFGLRRAAKILELQLIAQACGATDLPMRCCQRPLVPFRTCMIVGEQRRLGQKGGASGEIGVERLLRDREERDRRICTAGPFENGEGVFTIGYAEMKDISVEYTDGLPKLAEFKHELYVSFGEVTALYPENHIKKDVPTPGSSFDFQASVLGKMSGAPIFGTQGAVIRGVVSRSFQSEKHASGCMIGPVMTLPLGGGNSLKHLMDAGTEGISIVRGRGL